MPFGLANGPSHFQRIMDLVFSDLLGQCVMVFIDEIVIYSSDLTEHIKHLETVFERLAQYGLQIKAEKCKFAMEEIKLIGFVLNKHGIGANPDKTSVISTMPPPPKHKTSTILLRHDRILQAVYPWVHQLSSASD